MRNLLRKKFIRLIKFIPYKFRRKLAYIFSDSIKCNDGQLKRDAMFNFSILKGLDYQSQFLNLYVKSLVEAGDQNSDNIYKILRHLNLYSYIENIIDKNIEGDFAECGCFNGNSLFATRKLLDFKGSSKSIHVFDSFEGGLSEFLEKDLMGSSIQSLAEAEKVKNQFSSSFKVVSEKIKNYDNIFLNKGWIPEVFKSQKERKYSFVHIDVDLYQPTLDSYKYFFQRLNLGGIIVCDDYGYNQFPGATRAVDEFISSLNKDSYSYFIKHSFGTSVIIK